MLFFLAAAGQNALALSFGTPELESGLGERLRVVLPLTGTAKEPLTVDCVKLNASANEPYDVSNLVRATVIQRGSGQAVLLTTSQTMNDVVVSFEAGIGCGIWFSRRYTFFLDLPRDRLPAPAAAAPAPAPIEALVAAPAAASAPAKPPRRRRLRDDGISSPAAVAAARPAAPPSVVRRLRPEDEPGVLPRAGAHKPARKPARQGLAPPVRSMLKIDIGGIDDVLSDALRSPLEQSTGMRISGELGGNARPPAAATADAGFKQAHARYLAAMRDKPDPVSAENQALAQRLDAVAKDIASLKLELQTSAARAKELEASRVSWWWLLVAAVLSAAAAAGLVLLLRKPPARQLILIDPDERPKRERAAANRFAAAGGETDNDDAAGNTVITETIAMSRGQQVDRAARRARNQPAQEQDDAAASAGAPAEAGAASLAATGSGISASAAGGRAAGTPADGAATAGTVGTNAGAAGATSIPFDLPPPALTPGTVAPGATSKNATLKYSAPIAALKPAVRAPEDAVLRIIPQPELVALKPDKNSLTQELAAMEELSDESWASYRHPSDSSAVALPSGTLGASGGNHVKPVINLVPIDADTDASRASTIELNFDLDAEMANYEKAAAQTQPVALEFDPAAAAASAVSAQSGAQRGMELGAQMTPESSDPTSNAPTAATVDLLNFDFDDPAADADRTEKLPPPDRTAALAHQTNMPSSDQAMLMQVMMATASGVMESAQRQWDEGGATGALMLLIPYLQLAPPNTPPGPWVMLAHILRKENMQEEYAAVEKTFHERFGVPLPSWDQAAAFAGEQIGLARAPGIEIIAAHGRGTPALIGRLAGLAYRIDAPPVVLFDLQFHREVLLLAAESSVDDGQAAEVDFSL